MDFKGGRLERGGRRPTCQAVPVARHATPWLADAKAFTAAAADCGFEAVAALAPCYFKPSRLEVLVEWCARIAAAAPDLPFYYYDIPSLTHVRFDTGDFLTEAAPRIPNLAGIKFTNDDLTAYQACLGLEDGRFDIPWGIDEKLVDALAAGAKGAVGSTYNFVAPLYQELMAAFHKGDLDRARDHQCQSVELIGSLYAIGYFGAAKALMGRLACPSGRPALRSTIRHPSNWMPCGESWRTSRGSEFPAASRVT